jgi:hypothetical protein
LHPPPAAPPQFPPYQVAAKKGNFFHSERRAELRLGLPLNSSLQDAASRMTETQRSFENYYYDRRVVLLVSLPISPFILFQPL